MSIPGLDIDTNVYIHLASSNFHNKYKEEENDSVDVKSCMKQHPDNL